MEKLSMCRICLSDDIPCRSIVRTPLQEVYESLTTMPFVTEDIRPVVVCNLCCARLENSSKDFSLKEKCLQSENLFAELLQSNVQVNLQVMPDVHLSTEGVIQKTPNVFGNDEVKQENAEDNAAVERASNLEWDVPLSTVKEEPDDVDTDDVAVEQNDADPYHSALGLHMECDIPLDIVKKEPDDVKTYDVAVEQDDADPSHSAQGLHTECDIPLDIVKEEPGDDTGAPRLFAQKHRNDTLLNSPKRTDQTMDKVEERKRETRRDIEDTPVEKKEIVATGGNIDIRLHHEPSPTHRRTHTGKKPYQCNVCQKCLTSKQNLQYHILTHANEKPYECGVCKKCYISKSRLNVHMRTHTDEKPYQCNICKKCFTTKQNLNYHNSYTHGPETLSM